MLQRVFIPRGQSYFHLTTSRLHIANMELLAAVGSHTARLSVGSRLHTLQGCMSIRGDLLHLLTHVSRCFLTMLRAGTQHSSFHQSQHWMLRGVCASIHGLRSGFALETSHSQNRTER